MSRISEIISKKKKEILNIYFTAGFPELDSTRKLLKTLQDSGADMIELGIPYSDPLADGPVIQESSKKALENGMSIQYLFSQLKDFRNEIHLPVILMGYLNPVLQFGLEKFCRQASETGIDGLIIPDLPEYELESGAGALFKKYNLDFSFLVTPETSKERVIKLDRLSSGFLYAVSSSSTTGKKNDLTDLAGFLERINSYELKNPVLVGFGIHDKKSFDQACKHTNGAIVGSAYIKALMEGIDDPEQATRLFINNIRNSLSDL